MPNIRRILICIGCNDYQYMQSLSKCEKDARDMFALLTDANYGAYDQDTSVLLLSPDLSLVEKTMAELLQITNPSDIITLFFAGHGGVSKGSYYLALKNSDSNRMSLSALPLAKIFQVINEIAPAHCNILLDSCESGGLINDLAILLKPELIGDQGTSSISMFATSAANQEAYEDENGGLGTSCLLDVLSGKIVINTHSPFLDLVEVGRKVSESVISDTGQIPVSWGINLYGPSLFVKNPNYERGTVQGIFELTNIVPVSKSGQVIAEAAHEIWKLYHSDANNVTPEYFRAIFGPIVDKLSDQPSDLCNFIVGISDSLGIRARESNNSFALIEMLAGCVSLLLRHQLDPIVSETTKSLIYKIYKEIFIQLQVCQKGIRENSGYLVNAGPSDYFYLTLRITRIFGWAGLALQIKDEFNITSPEFEDLVQDVINTITDTYPNHLGGMSNEETPFILTFSCVAISHNLRSAAEAVIGSVFNNLVNSGGAIARTELGPRFILDYLKARKNNDYRSCMHLTARPSESLSLVLILSKIYELDAVVNPYLIKLDRVTHNIFIPKNAEDFGMQLIETGQNHIFEIGCGIWNIDDLVEQWSLSCVPELNADVATKNPIFRIASTCACLIFPDRSPWFLLAESF